MSPTSTAKPAATTPITLTEIENRLLAALGMMRGVLPVLDAITGWLALIPGSGAVTTPVHAAIKELEALLSAVQSASGAASPKP